MANEAVPVRRFGQAGACDWHKASDYRRFTEGAWNPSMLLTRHHASAAPATVVVLAALALLPSSAAASPTVCSPAAIQQSLVAAGKITPEDVDAGEVVNLVRCGDVTADGAKDAIFTVASGGTAGDTRFGVIGGLSDGGVGDLFLYRRGYKVGIARHDRRSFDVAQPHYRRQDPNCCPSSFRITRYTWVGDRFKQATPRRRRSAPARFYRP